MWRCQVPESLDQHEGLPLPWDTCRHPRAWRGTFFIAEHNFLDIWKSEGSGSGLIKHSYKQNRIQGERADWREPEGVGETLDPNIAPLQRDPRPSCPQSPAEWKKRMQVTICRRSSSALYLCCTLFMWRFANLPSMENRLQRNPGGFCGRVCRSLGGGDTEQLWFCPAASANISWFYLNYPRMLWAAVVRRTVHVVTSSSLSPRGNPTWTLICSRTSALIWSCFEFFILRVRFRRRQNK